MRARALCPRSALTERDRLLQLPRIEANLSKALTIFQNLQVIGAADASCYEHMAWILRNQEIHFLERLYKDMLCESLSGGSSVFSTFLKLFDDKAANTMFFNVLAEMQRRKVRLDRHSYERVIPKLVLYERFEEVKRLSMEYFSRREKAKGGSAKLDSGILVSAARACVATRDPKFAELIGEKSWYVWQTSEQDKRWAFEAICRCSRVSPSLGFRFLKRFKKSSSKLLDTQFFFSQLVTGCAEECEDGVSWAWDHLRRSWLEFTKYEACRLSTVERESRGTSVVNSYLKGLLSLGRVEEGLKLIGNLDPDLCTFTIVISHYSRQGDLVNSKRWFQRLQDNGKVQQDIQAITALCRVVLFVDADYIRESLELFSLYTQFNIKPDGFAVDTQLSGVLRLLSTTPSKELLDFSFQHADIVLSSFDLKQTPDTSSVLWRISQIERERVLNCGGLLSSVEEIETLPILVLQLPRLCGVLEACGFSAWIDGLWRVLGALRSTQMERYPIYVYNAKIKAFGMIGDIVGAKEVLNLLRSDSVKPNTYTFISLLEAIRRDKDIKAKDIDWVSDVAERVLGPPSKELLFALAETFLQIGHPERTLALSRSGSLKSESRVYEVKALCKVGEFVSARKVFNTLKGSKTTEQQLYAALMNCAPTASHADELLKEMQQRGIVPRQPVYAEALTVCQRCGDLELARRIKEDMISFGVYRGLKPRAEAWIGDCLVSFENGWDSGEACVLLEQLIQVIKEKKGFQHKTEALPWISTLDLPKDDQLQALTYHAEKKMLAFLLNHPHLSAKGEIFLRINLMMCQDCELFFELVSEVTSRVIVVQEPSRTRRF